MDFEIWYQVKKKSKSSISEFYVASQLWNVDLNIIFSFSEIYVMNGDWTESILSA